MANPTPPAPAPVHSGSKRLTPVVAAKFKRIGIYGAGGIGKSKLATMAPKPGFLDIENRLGHLPGTMAFQAGTFEQAQAAIRDRALWSASETVVVDTLTKIEELCVVHVCATNGVTSLADIGFGRGNQQVFDLMRGFINDLEQLYKGGKHIITVMHDVTTHAPNTAGEDWLRTEILLQNSEKCSVRQTVKNWLDVLAHIQIDVTVDKEGRGKGNGSRAIYTTETPQRMAKCMKPMPPIVYTDGSPEFWNKLFAA